MVKYETSFSLSDSLAHSSNQFGENIIKNTWLIPFKPLRAIRMYMLSSNVNATMVPWFIKMQTINIVF